MRKYIGWVPIIALAWVVFQVYIATSGPLAAQLQRSIHLAFALGLTFAIYRKGKESNIFIIRFLDYFFIILSLSFGVYVYFQYERLLTRIQFTSELAPVDYFYGIVITLLVLEASRRAIGNSMTVLALLFLAYAFLGPYMPSLLRHNAFDVGKVVEVMLFSSEGILGSPVGVSVDYVFYFILFAAFLEISGAGKVFIDVAFKLTGRSKGGPAKAAVLASSGMGSISGSSVANVVSTGVLTIPLMKRVGFSSKFAASVEALASNGGQILPPIMGAAAFLMANNLGITYVQVALAAIIPAVLYYIALFMMVHIQADKLGMKKLTKKEHKDSVVPSKVIFERLHLLFPLGILVVLIFSGYTLQRAAVLSMTLLVIVSYARKLTRLSVKNILDACINGAKQAVQVAMPCAVAGVIVGVIAFSGLGLKFTSLIISWSFGSVVISILLVSVACIILGMGMPTTSAYIMASVLLAPALIKLGFEPIAAHMFTMYFAVYSMITPPVALASFAAASIAKSNVHETGAYAFYLGIPGFLVGYSLLINPSLLLIGDTSSIVWSVVSTVFGVFAITVAVMGHYYVILNPLTRLLFLAASIALIIPENFTDLIGLAMLVSLMIIQFRKRNTEVLQNIQNISTKSIIG